ncbi:C45 family autoproteolytic acyltransferase/hydrolase [Nonomuraea sp. NPDC059194]|uniref:C45 family autoproteolytic acyltransferase/hydolase n=1 Tax=Nonomuraea sp. NPDC059194 TaxID=3346764 RepID=UPI0036C0F3EC
MTSIQIAGGENDFQLVRHLTVRGDQFEIGKALAREARTRSGWAPRPGDQTVNRARMAWFERFWPQHHERLDGVAAAFDLDPDRDDLVLDGLNALPAGSGCSALWCPPSAATDGHGRIARNYDFFTLTTSEIMMGQAAVPGELPMASRPYVITTVPDEGLASTVITMNELDGCMDGVNEAGLAVVLLIADVRNAAPPESFDLRVGLSSVQLPRFVLDTCENVEQAKRALLMAKHYDHGMPLHYLIADASGQAFVWESERIIDAGDAPQCVTNHPLHRHPDPMLLPADDESTMDTFGRLRTLHERSKEAPLSAEGLAGALREVAAGADKEWRTTWTSVLDTHDRTLTARFYLGDTPEGGTRFTGEVRFATRPDS